LNLTGDIPGNWDDWMKHLTNRGNTPQFKFSPKFLWHSTQQWLHHLLTGLYFKLSKDFAFEPRTFQFLIHHLQLVLICFCFIEDKLGDWTIRKKAIIKCGLQLVYVCMCNISVSTLVMSTIQLCQWWNCHVSDWPFSRVRTFPHVSFSRTFVYQNIYFSRIQTIFFRSMLTFD